MKSIVLLFTAMLLAACAKAPSGMEIAAQVESAQNSFTVDDFIAVAMEYQGPSTLVGVDTYGPTDKEEVCQRSTAAAVVQSDDMLPHGHTMVTTCLHVKFGGPLPRGAAVTVPVAGTPFEYMTIGVEYTHAGDFVGAEALHPAPDVKTCMREARDVIGSNYKDGHVAAGNSLILYCVPVPVIHQGSRASDGGIV